MKTEMCDIKKDGQIQRSTVHIHLRMFMYVLTIVLHICNVGLTHVWCFRIADDPDLKFLYPFWPRLFTVWTIAFQVVHAIIGLICDRDELKNSKNTSKFIEKLRSFNSTFFCSLVWPSAWVCCLTFWTFFTYDRNLLFYSLIRKIMTPVTNHIGHTFIVATVSCEALLRPRQEPKSHWLNVFYQTCLILTYTVVLVHTYCTAGTWIYPFYDLSYGSIYFYLIHIVTFPIIYGSYFALWPISRIKFYGQYGFEKDKNLLLNSSLQKRLQ